MVLAFLENKTKVSKKSVLWESHTQVLIFREQYLGQGHGLRISKGELTFTICAS